jgi:hypothetical protein
MALSVVLVVDATTASGFLALRIGEGTEGRFFCRRLTVGRRDQTETRQTGNIFSQRAQGLSLPRPTVVTFSQHVRHHLLATGRFVTTLPPRAAVRCGPFLAQGPARRVAPSARAGRDRRAQKSNNESRRPPVRAICPRDRQTAVFRNGVVATPSPPACQAHFCLAGSFTAVILSNSMFHNSPSRFSTLRK